MSRNPARIDVAAWLAWSPADLGCWIERTLAYRDPFWNCSSPRLPPAADGGCDPRRHDGPQIPDDLAPHLDGSLTGAELTWENGALQAALFSFSAGSSPDDMRRALGIEGASVEGAASDGPAECDAPCYEIVAFEADPACGD